MDEERIKKRLALLQETANLLTESLLANEEAYRNADRLTRDATERRLQVISETELDIIRTLYKDLGRRVVGDEESLMDAMRDQLGKKTIEHVKRRRALRNKLVHAYMDVDQAEVYEEASELEDVAEFGKVVAKLAGTK